MIAFKRISLGTSYIEVMEVSDVEKCNRLVCFKKEEIAPLKSETVGVDLLLVTLEYWADVKKHVLRRQ